MLHHLLGDVPHLDELFDNGLSEVLPRVVVGIAPGIFRKTALQKELRQLVEEVLEIQGVQQRAFPFRVFGYGHRGL